jgi:hypothetical protein
MRALVLLDSGVADRLVGRLIGQMPPWIRPVDVAPFCTTGNVPPRRRRRVPATAAAAPT